MWRTAKQGGLEHVCNLLDFARSPHHPVQNSKLAHRSWGLVQHSRIALPAGRVLHFVVTNERFVNDQEADKPLTNEHLEPWSMRGPVELQP